MKIKGLERFFLACSLCLMVCFTFSAAQAENSVGEAKNNFTNKDLLEFPKSERDAFITGAMLSTAHTLYIFHSKDMGQCFSNWFLEQPNNRIAEIEEYMQENPNHTPSTVLLALPQLECGRLRPKKAKNDELSRETKP